MNYNLLDALQSDALTDLARLAFRPIERRGRKGIFRGCPYLRAWDLELELGSAKVS